MTYYLKSGTSFRVTSKESLDLHEMLPPGNYTVDQDAFGNFYLQQIDSFDIPAKLYGKTTRYTQRIIDTFMQRAQSTGVLLNGEKGSGKTLLAKNISHELAKQGVPTILINRNWTNEGFFKLLQDIEQPCIVLFDEFEKVYDTDEQEKILTLLDGVFGSKKLYLLTVNNKWRVDIHMRNRPGRIYYLIDFKGLDVDFIAEYCNENLKDTSFVENICSISTLFSEFNFDMLKALVEEMNRYGESPSEVLEMLNAKPEFDSGTDYEVTIIDNGQEIKKEIVQPAIFNGNPFASKGVDVGYDPNPDDEDANWRQFKFKPENLINVDSTSGKFVFEDKGTRLILTRVKKPVGNFDYNLI